MNLPYISPSRMGLAFSCGEKYRMAYGTDIFCPPSLTFVRGGAIHKTNETNLKQKQLTKVDMLLSDMQDCTRDAFRDRLKNGVLLSKEDRPAKKRILGETLDESIKLTRVYKEQIAPTINDPLEVEQPFTVFLDGLDIPLHGRPDSITKTAMHDLKVTGNSMAEEQIKTELQPAFYGLAHTIETGQESVNFTIDNISAGKCPKAQQQTMSVTSQHHTWIKRKILAFVKMIKAEVFLPPASYPAWVCTPKYCGYHGICDYTK